MNIYKYSANTVMQVYYFWIALYMITLIVKRVVSGVSFGGWRNCHVSVFPCEQG